MSTPQRTSHGQRKMLESKGNQKIDQIQTARRASTYANTICPVPDGGTGASAVAAVILLLVILTGGAVFVVRLLRRKAKTPSRPPEDGNEAYVVEEKA